MEIDLKWLITALILASAAPIALWIAGAIYFDAGGEGTLGGLFAAGWLASVLLLFFVWQPLWQPYVCLLTFSALFLGWWFQLKPSQHREWEPAVAVLARTVREGEAVTIENMRNFDYPTPKSCTPRYESRTFHLANLKSVDIIFFTWGSPWMSHPVLVFDFGPDGRVCMSIEVRYRKGQRFSVLRSLYRRQELIIVAADERDIILRRTKRDTNEKAFLYHFYASNEELRSAFLDYAGAIEGLFTQPRWYHGVCTNCTTTFYRLPNSRPRWDWRVLVNGRLDQALYESGRLDRTRPFLELRKMGYLNDIANGAPENGFGDYIRQELERRCHG